MEENKNIVDENVKIYLPNSKKRIPENIESDEVKIYVSKK